MNGKYTFLLSLTTAKVINRKQKQCWCFRNLDPTVSALPRGINMNLWRRLFCLLATSSSSAWLRSGPPFPSWCCCSPSAASTGALSAAVLLSSLRCRFRVQIVSLGGVKTMAICLYLFCWRFVLAGDLSAVSAVLLPRGTFLPRRRHSLPRRPLRLWKGSTAGLAATAKLCSLVKVFGEELPIVNFCRVT